MKIADLAAAGIFALFLLGPVLSLIALGNYSSMAENPPTWGTMDWPKFAVQGDYRAAVAKSLFVSTPLGMSAIGTRSVLDYDVLHSVDTKEVVSGTDGWLFYKPAFWNGRCLLDADISRALYHTKAMEDVAAGAGVQLLLTVSPDKSVVYPDRLGLVAGGYAYCKQESSQLWRAKARAVHGLALIDHLEALKGYEGPEPLYWPTDTHWNDRAVGLVYVQLVNVLLGQHVATPPVDPQANSKETDLMRMLRRQGKERGPRLDLAPITAGPKVPGRTVIVHDSFYGAARSMLAALFSDWVDAPVHPFPVDLLPKVQPERIIINSVERAVFSRLNYSDLSWNSTFASSLLQLNRESSKCQVTSVDPATLRAVNLTTDGDGWHTGRDPQIFIPLPRGDAPCISVSVTAASPTMVQLFLPDADGGYRDGLSVDYKAPPGEDAPLALQLPASYAGKILRFDPVSGGQKITKLTVAVGTGQLDAKKGD